MIFPLLMISCMTATSLQRGSTYALAPHPMYAISGPEGQTKYELVEVKGEKYIIGWDEKGSFATFEKVPKGMKIKVSNDEGFDPEKPLIVKVSKTCYAIIHRGVIKFKHIQNNMEALFDSLFKIPPIPPKPPIDDNGNGHWEEPTPTPLPTPTPIQGRFEWP